MRYSVDFVIGNKSDWEPTCEFTRDYLTKEEVYKLLKEFPPSDGRKNIYENHMSWTTYDANNKFWIDIFVYNPTEF